MQRQLAAAAVAGAGAEGVRAARGIGEQQLAGGEPAEQRVEQPRRGRGAGGRRRCAPRQRQRGDGGGVVTVHRVVETVGGSGLVKNGTRFSHSFSACQWIRITTPAVNQR